MFSWFSANWINILLIAIIALVVFLLIRGMIRDRKAGKRSCGGNCAGCGACGGCSSCNRCAAISDPANSTPGSNSR